MVWAWPPGWGCKPLRTTQAPVVGACVILMSSQVVAGISITPLPAAAAFRASFSIQRHEGTSFLDGNLREPILGA